MAKEDFEKKLAKVKAAQQRKLEKQLAIQKDRLNDSAYIEKQKSKKYAAKLRQSERQRERLKEKIASPDYLKSQKVKQKKALVKGSGVSAKKSLKPSTKKISSKGLKGRARTAEEKRLEKELADIGCICCLNKGWYNSAMQVSEGQRFISMHHVAGRTQPWAHAKQLPLCHFHHQTPAPDEAPADLFPLHGGSISAWEKINGTQEDLLKQVYLLIGECRPWITEDTLNS
jgi:hypothetical protein